MLKFTHHVLIVLVLFSLCASMDLQAQALSADVSQQQDSAPANGAADGQTPLGNRSKMTFMDSKLFDARLGRELESGKDVVEIEVTGRVPLSNIPPRLDRWMVKSAEEGKVELVPSEPAVKTRFLGVLLPLVLNAAGMMKSYREEASLDRAKNYDTKLYYKKDDFGDTVIEKIVLTRRKPN